MNNAHRIFNGNKLKSILLCIPLGSSQAWKNEHVAVARNKMRTVRFCETWTTRSTFDMAMAVRSVSGAAETGYLPWPSEVQRHDCFHRAYCVHDIVTVLLPWHRNPCPSSKEARNSSLGASQIPTVLSPWTFECPSNGTQARTFTTDMTAQQKQIDDLLDNAHPIAMLRRPMAQHAMVARLSLSIEAAASMDALERPVSDCTRVQSTS